MKASVVVLTGCLLVMGTLTAVGAQAEDSEGPPADSTRVETPKSAPASPNPKVEKHMAELTAKLNLTMSQVDQIRPLVVSQIDREAQIAKTYKGAAHRAERVAQLKQLRADTNKQIEALLTADQVAAFHKHARHLSKATTHKTKKTAAKKTTPKAADTAGSAD